MQLITFAAKKIPRFAIVHYLPSLEVNIIKQEYYWNTVRVSVLRCNKSLIISMLLDSRTFLENFLDKLTSNLIVLRKYLLNIKIDKINHSHHITFQSMIL